MKMQMDIICKKFEQKKIYKNKIYVGDESEEFYIIPLTRTYELDGDEDVFKLSFKNQLLWLKYSNQKGLITIKDYFDFEDCVIIRSDDILDVYVKIKTDNYKRKNVWHSQYNVNMNKRFLGRWFLMLPIFSEDAILVEGFGGGVAYYEIYLFTNEVLLGRVLSKNNGHGYLGVDNNFLLNKEALFVELSDDDTKLFTSYD